MSVIIDFSIRFSIQKAFYFAFLVVPKPEAVRSNIGSASLKGQSECRPERSEGSSLKQLMEHEMLRASA